jgi:hypothetical protein
MRCIIMVVTHVFTYSCRLGGGAPPLPDYGYDGFGTQPQSQNQTQPSQSQSGYPTGNSQPNSQGQPLFTQQSGHYNTQGPASSLSQESFAFESQGSGAEMEHAFVSPLSQDSST